nr:hypothetical protein [Tanacetum cinerariifolium]
MAAPIISILSDSSEESVGSCDPRVILFGAILVIIPVIPEIPIILVDPLVAPELGTVSAITLVEVLDLVDYSFSSDSDPSEDSLPPVPNLPLVSPLGSSSHDTLAPSSEFPVAPIVALPKIRRWLSILIRPGEAIPSFNFTTPILTGRTCISSFIGSLFFTRLIFFSFTFRSSGHTPPDTTDADLSTHQRFIHRLLTRTPGRSEAFRRWRSAPLSNPPNTSESSLGLSFERSLDSSSLISRPSRKRRRSPTSSVPSPTYDSRSIAPTPADLLPPRKRFRDSYSLEDGREEQMEVDTADAKAVANVGISDGVVAHSTDGVGMRVEINASDVLEDDEEFKAEASTTNIREIIVDPLVIGVSYASSRGGIPDLEDTIYAIVHYMSEVRIEWITEIETTQRQLEASQLVASGERASLVERIGSLRLEYLKRWLLMRRLVPPMLSRLRIKARTDVTEIMEMVVIEMVRMEMVEMEIQMKMVERTIGTKIAVSMSWRDFMKLMTEMYCPRNKVQKMEPELMVPDEEDQIESLMDQKLKGYDVKNPKNKRRLEVNQRDNRGQQPPFKWPNVRGQNVARAYTADNNKRKPYNGPLPLYNKCKLHHEGPCTVRCRKYNKRVVTCYECGRQGHSKSDCLKLKDQNRGNKNGVGEARGKAYVLGGGDTNPDSNVVKGMFLLNNHYASMIFDSGADRSFASTTFSTLLDITPDTLDVSYAVELTDIRISETNTVLRGCTLCLLGHPFNIDLMPVELGSFDVIISMDWLANHHAVIMCDERIVRIPYGDDVLIVQDDEGGKGEKSSLSIISCTKM